jgi:CubicO group peptidase (beta-lactamase class C family)
VGIEPIGAGGAYRAYYGLGFYKAGSGMRDAPSTELRTPAGFGHGGSTDSYLWIEPDLGVVFAFLSNRWGPVAPPQVAQALNATLAAAGRI